MDRALVVVNPSARGLTPELLPEIQRVCRSHQADPVTVVPDGPAAVAAAVEDGLSASPGEALVLVVGGDGTVRTVADALAGGDAAMVMVPAGTGNSWYRALWADRPWPDVVAEVLTGRARVRAIDRMAVRGGDSGAQATAMLGATAGLLAEVVRVSETLTGVSGRERYTAAVGPALEAHRPFPVRVTLDGQDRAEGPASVVAVGGARHRSGTFELLARSVLDDGLLDVCVIPGVDPEAFVEIMGEVITGTHLGRPGVTYGQGRRVRIERLDGAPLEFECDGDRWPHVDRAINLEVTDPVRMFAPLDPVAG